MCIQVLTFAHVEEGSLTTLFKKKQYTVQGRTTGPNQPCKASTSCLWKSFAKETGEKFKYSNLTTAIFGCCYKQAFQINHFKKLYKQQ